MKRLLTCCILFVFIFTVVSCTSFPDIDGGYPFTRSDVREIESLIAHRPDIKKPITHIHMHGPDEAEVVSGRTFETRDPVTVFTVRRKSGRWYIDNSSIHTGETLIVS